MKPIYRVLLVGLIGGIWLTYLHQMVSECPRRDYLNEKISGVVIGKFKDINDKSVTKLKVKTRNGIYIFPNYDIPFFWNEVKPNDSISKKENSQYIILSFRGVKKSYSPMCGDK